MRAQPGVRFGPDQHPADDDRAERREGPAARALAGRERPQGWQDGAHQGDDGGDEAHRPGGQRRVEQQHADAGRDARERPEHDRRRGPGGVDERERGHHGDRRDDERRERDAGRGPGAGGDRAEEVGDAVEQGRDEPEQHHRHGGPVNRTRGRQAPTGAFEISAVTVVIMRCE
ncbi:hypothetical protein GCM10025783_07720 [Amnibacterium soli]|uniref:Uncharacterized protein n=1 Tax=Amnibacterium soli TaxID=1282736 RepID=A0ABP8YTS7_9MICO